MFPSVSKIPLSKERIDSVIKEIKESFYNSALGREIVKPTPFPKENTSEGNFVNYGFNSIVDKIWFVDGAFPDSFYSHQGIGADFGIGLAESETKFVVDEILADPAVTTLQFDNPIESSDLKSAIDILKTRGRNPTICITNIRDEIKLWYYPEFQIRGGLYIPTSFSGLLNDIQPKFSRTLPDGISLILDPAKLGRLLIKKSIEETTFINDIAESDYEKIMKEIPSIERENLPEKARVLTYETIKVKIDDPLSVVILKGRRNNCEQ
jgi:hypothetical protein